MLETLNYLRVQDMRVGCGTRWGRRFTSPAPWQEVEKDPNPGPNLICGLEFLPNGSCFPEEFRCGKAQVFPTSQPPHCQSPQNASLSAQGSGGAAPLLPPALTPVRELFPVAVFCEITQHLYFN